MTIPQSVGLSVGIEIVDDGIGGYRRPAAGETIAGIAGLARRLETADVHYWVLGAARGERGSRADASLDPSLVATVAARHSTQLGLVVAAAAHRDHPYNLARRLVSVDHAAHGRVGWFALDADRRIALNATSDTWTGASLSAAHTAAAIAAVRTLWRTWPLESVVGDVDAGVFADTAQIRYADVRGEYSISGPLNVPGSVQGDLPVWQHAGAGENGATSGADLVVIEDGDPVPQASAVVRIRATAGAGAAVERIAGTPGVVGIVLRLPADALGPVLDEILPAARDRGIVSAPAPGTLRQRLGLPVANGPDLSNHRLAFAGAPNPGGRL